MLKVGDIVKVINNGRIVTHHTPRWAYEEVGTVVRLNDLTVTISLLGKYEGEKIRVDYADIKILARGENA